MRKIVMMRKVIEKYYVSILLALWAFFILFIMSPDSPIHGPYMRTDSACFFMGGKALMNGLLPYVDFSDSKGTFLWLIYGIGYLISPRSYFGVFIISVCFYSLTFYYNYKIANIFLSEKKQSIAASLLMAFAYFGFVYHFEVRVEDFSTTFVSIGLYKLFEMLYCKDGGKSVRQFLIIGGCFTPLLLMKFTIAGMYGVIILVAIWYQVRENKQFLFPLFWIISGGLLIALPFVIHLVITGTFLPFVNEYFFKTLSTAPSMTACWANGLVEWAKMIILNKFILLEDSYLIFIILGGGLLGFYVPRYKWVPVLVGLSFYLLSSFHFGGHYYYCICSIFLLYLFIDLMLIIRPSISKKYVILFLVYSVIWGFCENRYGKLSDYLIWHSPKDKIHYEKISSIMSEKKKPLVLYYELLDYGFGLESEPLPAGKYWMCQNGCSPQMQKEHKELLYSAVADYVIMRKSVLDEDITIEKLAELNYHQCYECSYHVDNNWNSVVDIVVFKKL